MRSCVESQGIRRQARRRDETGHLETVTTKKTVTELQQGGEMDCAETRVNDVAPLTTEVPAPL